MGPPQPPRFSRAPALLSLHQEHPLQWANGLPTSGGKSGRENEKLAGVSITNSGPQLAQVSSLCVTPCNAAKTSCGRYCPNPHFTDWEVKAGRDEVAPRGPK